MSAARSEAPTSTRATTNATTTVQDANDGVSAAFALTLSVVSSVSLVIVNKHFFTHTHILLTLFHRRGSPANRCEYLEFSPKDFYSVSANI